MPELRLRRTRLAYGEAAHSLESHVVGSCEVCAPATPAYGEERPRLVGKFEGYTPVPPVRGRKPNGAIGVGLLSRADSGLQGQRTRIGDALPWCVSCASRVRNHGGLDAFGKRCYSRWHDARPEARRDA